MLLEQNRSALFEKKTKIFLILVAQHFTALLALSKNLLDKVWTG